MQFILIDLNKINIDTSEYVSGLLYEYESESESSKERVKNAISKLNFYLDEKLASFCKIDNIDLVPNKEDDKKVLHQFAKYLCKNNKSRNIKNGIGTNKCFIHHDYELEAYYLQNYHPNNNKIYLDNENRFANELLLYPDDDGCFDYSDDCPSKIPRVFGKCLVIKLEYKVDVDVDVNTDGKYKYELLYKPINLKILRNFVKNTLIYKCIKVDFENNTNGKVHTFNKVYFQDVAYLVIYSRMRHVNSYNFTLFNHQFTVIFDNNPIKSYINVDVSKFCGKKIIGPAFILLKESDCIYKSLSLVYFKTLLNLCEYKNTNMIQIEETSKLLPNSLPNGLPNSLLPNSPLHNSLPNSTLPNNPCIYVKILQHKLTNLIETNNLVCLKCNKNYNECKNKCFSN